MIRYILMFVGLTLLVGCSSFQFGADKVETEAVTVEGVDVKIEAKDGEKPQK